MGKLVKQTKLQAVISRQQQIVNKCLNNCSSHMQYEQQDYILLIRVSKRSQQCFMYLSDCGNNFWIQQITPQYVQDVKKKVKLQSNLESFCNHLVKGIYWKTSIASLETSAIIQVSIRIAEGFEIKCELKLNKKYSKFGFQFEKISKKFYMMIYDVRGAQSNKIQQEKDQAFKNFDDKTTEIYDSSLKNSANVIQNSIPSIPASSKKANASSMKGKDLVNPNKKKICKKGAKF